ncbi:MULTISPECIES: B12-binding domain-containing radical SAM protein [unclassified Streptomyces]|uniref:B12-binding domain-containing radical SAM protein n=1 Tax=unclassified Streptomyces TaxID=2593676 RepID=UPI0028C3C9D3|nr:MULTISPECIES: radical SAM protein [unclassified Streptomyces]WNO72643.1 radical SAM protein [Streptomyces sp. AM8-1-1]
MRVLLISTNKIRVPRPALPIGMAYIGAAIKKSGHEVDVLDLLWESRELKAVREKLTSTTYDVVGIAVRNLDNLTFVDPIFFGPLTEKIVRCVRKYTKATVVLGGSGFSVEPLAFFEYAQPDFGIAGEGEVGMAQLLQYLEVGGSLDTISGLCYVDDEGCFVHNPPNTGFDIGALVPDRSLYDPRYFEEGVSAASDLTRDTQPAIETLQTKRGCKLYCSYCIIRKTEGKGNRFKEPAAVVDEIQRAMFENPEVKEFEIVDATFNFPLDYAADVCNEMVKAKLDVPWYCQLTPNAVTPEFVELLAAAGCIRVDLGTDAFTDEALADLLKGFDLARVVEVDRWFTASSIEHTHCVFLGGPGETSAALRESIDFTERYLNPAQIYANLGIRILSGTKLLKQAVKAGIMEEGQGTFVPAYYVEPEIVRDRDTLDFVRNAYLSHKNWYLWWGLSGQSLSDRAQYSAETVAEMQREYTYVMADKTRLKPARPKSKPVALTLGAPA